MRIVRSTVAELDAAIKAYCKKNKRGPAFVLRYLKGEYRPSANKPYRRFAPILTTDRHEVSIEVRDDVPAQQMLQDIVGFLEDCKYTRAYRKINRKTGAPMPKRRRPPSPPQLPLPSLQPLAKELLMPAITQVAAPAPSQKVLSEEEELGAVRRAVERLLTSLPASTKLEPNTAKMLLLLICGGRA